jgi:hypothetical protein
MELRSKMRRFLSLYPGWKMVLDANLPLHIWAICITVPALGVALILYMVWAT